MFNKDEFCVETQKFYDSDASLVLNYFVAFLSKEYKKPVAIAAKIKSGIIHCKKS